MNSIIIRPVQSSEIDILSSISKQTFLESYLEQNSKENMDRYVSDHFNRDSLKQEFDNPNSTFYFASLHSDIVGYLKINTGPAQSESNHPLGLEIERIYVLTSFQRRKIGQRLLEKSIKIAHEFNLKYIWLGVWEENKDAIQFYLKMSFKKFGTHVFKLGEEKQTDVLMKHELT